MLGDVGGLFDGLRLIIDILIAPGSVLMVKFALFKTIYGLKNVNRELESKYVSK